MTTRERTARPAKILLVDDDPENRDLVRFALERDGHTVVTADAGIEGLEVKDVCAGRRRGARVPPGRRLRRHHDAWLDGYAVASALRRDLGPAAWIVALSGLPEHRSRNWVSGFKLHLQKPVPPETIRAVVRAALQESVSV